MQYLSISHLRNKIAPGNDNQGCIHSRCGHPQQLSRRASGCDRVHAVGRGREELPISRDRLEGHPQDGETTLIHRLVGNAELLRLLVQVVFKVGDADL